MFAYMHFLLLILHMESQGVQAQGLNNYCKYNIFKGIPHILLFQSRVNTDYMRSNNIKSLQFGRQWRGT